jgi:uncharacterized membrane protein YebE (DUF533 family)
MKSPLLRGRALLFVALSGVAVPACQHYEAGDAPERGQAQVCPAIPDSAPPQADTRLSSSRV